MNKIILSGMDRLYHTNFKVYKPLYFTYKYLTNLNKIKLIKRLLIPGDTVADVGANIGFFSTLFSRWVGPTGRVYAFEPDNINFRHLKNNTTQFQNVRLIHKAVTRKTGKIKLYTSNTLNVDHQVFDNGEGRSYLTVPSVSLDSLFARKRLNLIKVDTQGFDYQVILGARNILRKNNPPAILSEFWPYGLHMAGNEPQDYLDFLTNFGYKITWFSDFNHEEIPNMIKNKHYYTDFVAIKP